MSNWLIGLSSRSPTGEEALNDSLKAMPVQELNKLAFDIDPCSFQTRAEKLHEKLAAADKSGRELAHENSDLEKIAFIPALLAGAARLAPMAGKAAGALGGAKGIIGGVAKDLAIGTAASKVMGALKPAAPAASAAGEVAGGFKYAFAGGGLLQRAASYTVRNPGTALTAAGAVGGALMAPRDPQTGQKQYLRGAMIGGVGAAGANALSNGAIANKMRSSVMSRESPLLGQGTRKYLMDAAAHTQGKVPGANGRYEKMVPSAATGQTPPTTPAQSGYMGGPVTGMPKVAQEQFLRMSPAEQILFVAYLDKQANQQTLTYDPATKTFTRQHLTSSPGSEAVQGAGAAPIPAGHSEMVRNSGTSMAPYGSKEYLQSRMQQAGVGTSRFSSPAQSAASASTAPQSVGRKAKWEMNEGMGVGRPVINKRPAVLPGNIGGVAGIGAAAAKPRGLPTMAGLTLARR